MSAWFCCMLNAREAIAARFSINTSLFCQLWMNAREQPIAKMIKKKKTGPKMLG